MTARRELFNQLRAQGLRPGSVEWKTKVREFMANRKGVPVPTTPVVARQRRRRTATTP